jgi:isopentenyl-diphosphate delta-isomerase type 1
MSLSEHQSPIAIVRDDVVLLDARGRPCGAMPKRSVHGADTPLHLAFSCHVVDGAGRTLLTRRAVTKSTWPATWTNACCGHPRPDESLREAVTRRLYEELGLTPRRLALALPDFVYRAERDGMVEHELCPVVVAEVDREPALALDAGEVDAYEWTPWTAMIRCAHEAPASLSPWAVAQIARLEARESLRAWLDDDAFARLLDAPIALEPGSAARRLRTVPPVDPIGTVRTPVERRLSTFVDARVREMRDLDDELEPVIRVVRDLVLAGGKRLRPAFVYWGAHASAGEPDATRADAAFTIGAAVEMLHAFALLHDDVMDRSELRRGAPSAHRALAHLHRAASWHGDADWFGTSAAVLAGDLAFVWADQLLDRAWLPAAAAARARAAFTTLRSEVMAGQYLDLRLAACAASTEADAARVALLKSARYTVTRPLQLGRALAKPGADAVDDALAAYGDAVGFAFQLRDDVLGVFGNPDDTGKGRDDDLREGKRTLLVMRALALATPTARRTLEAALGNPVLTTTDADRSRDVIASTGALASVEALIGAQQAIASDALAAIPEPARTAFAELARLATTREH